MAPPLDRDYSRDPNIKALKSRGLLIRGLHYPPKVPKLGANINLLGADVFLQESVIGQGQNPVTFDYCREPAGTLNPI